MTTPEALKGIATIFEIIHENLSALRSAVESTDDEAAVLACIDLEHATLVAMRRLRLRLGIPYHDTITYEVSDAPQA